MLEIKNLFGGLSDPNQEILHGLNLQIAPGEIHFLMGPNGSGKSTLGKIIAGHPDYEIVSGEIKIDGEEINELSPAERAKLGVFLAFQYPLEIPGLNLENFLRLAYNSTHPDSPLTVRKFSERLIQQAELINYPLELLTRNLNEGFSGGEKKKTEMLQMAVLEPKYIILDETDSGLDIDALRDVFEGISRMLGQSANPPGLLVITHYHRVLEFIPPTFVHIIKDGKIIQTGGAELAKQIDENGYSI